MTLAALTVALALTAHGPQIYQSGATPGWHVDNAVFMNEATDAAVLGPVQHGRPRDPEAVIALDPPRSVRVWTRPGTDWSTYLVQFDGPNAGGLVAGQDIAPSITTPWPAGPATISRIYHHPKESS